VARVPLELAYPQVVFRRRSRNWWARLTGQPAECAHADPEQTWMATLIPDKVYLRGKGRVVRQPLRPEASLCLDCLVDVVKPELAAFAGRVVAFEPDAKSFSQYFFVGREDFEAAGLQPEVASAIGRRLSGLKGSCEECSRTARWLWFSRNEVRSLDEIVQIESAPGRLLCAPHGAAAFDNAMRKVDEANLFYVNVPYGESGAYLWI